MLYVQCCAETLRRWRGCTAQQHPWDQDLGYHAVVGGGKQNPPSGCCSCQSLIPSLLRSFTPPHHTYHVMLVKFQSSYLHVSLPPPSRKVMPCENTPGRCREISVASNLQPQQSLLQQGAVPGNMDIRYLQGRRARVGDGGLGEAYRDSYNYPDTEMFHSAH